MKPKIHPKVFQTKVSCACGESFTTEATVETIKVEICSKCHPFFTGKQKFVDTAGRVEKFHAKYGKDSRPEARKKKKKAEKDLKKVEALPADNAEPEKADAPRADANS